MPIDYSKGKIYMVTNDITDEIYFGSTAQKQLSMRMGSHFANARNPARSSQLYNAMRLHGADHFTIHLDHLFPCNSKDELEAEETKTMLAAVKAGKTLYNSRIDGKHSDETKKKMAARQAGAGNNAFTMGTIFLRSTAKSHCFVFSWSEQGKSRQKSFNTGKWGYLNAKRMAEAERQRVYPEWRREDQEEQAIDDLLRIDL